jgi:hypothetical protein
MLVHYDTGGKAAPCGYVYAKRMLGLDRSFTWDFAYAHHVTCPLCLRTRPTKRKLQRAIAEASKPFTKGSR